MKAFYTDTQDGGLRESGVPAALVSDTSPYINTRARVAVYDATLAAPRVEEIEPRSTGEYIEELSSRVYDIARSQGGSIPYTVVREVAENLVHASFAEPVVSVLDGGNTIRFADQGPGIRDKERAVLPGFTSATGSMKAYIRGVGSGLPIVKDYLAAYGGELVIEDNVGSQGAVVTIACRSRRSHAVADSILLDSPATTEPPQTTLDLGDTEKTGARKILTTRQKQVLALVMESGMAGPSLVSRELGVGVSTAYRDLASLEDMGFIVSDAGKRNLTELGLRYLDELTNGFGSGPGDLGEWE